MKTKAHALLLSSHNARRTGIDTILISNALIMPKGWGSDALGIQEI